MIAPTDGMRKAGPPFAKGDPRAKAAGKKGGLVSVEHRRRVRLASSNATLERLAGESFHTFFAERLGFRDPSWAAWRLVAKLLDGVALADLSPEEHAVYRRLSGRTTVPARVLVLLILAGRGSGKTIFEAARIAYRATRLYQLARGEVAQLLLLAGDQQQAGTLFDYVLEFLIGDAELRALVVRQRQDSLHLAHHVVVQVRHSHWRRVRGPTYAGVAADELSFWWSDESASNPDSEVLRAVKPGLLKLRGGPGELLLATTPYMQAGATWQMYEQFYGQEHPSTLVLHGDTRTFNPTMDATAIQAAVADDPLAAAEYDATFRADLAAFLSPAAIEAVIEPGIVERPPQAGVSYQAFADMSGGAKDSLALAIAHLSEDGELAIVDVVRDRPPPLDIEGTIAEWAALLRAYGVASVTGDKYAKQLTVEAWARAALSYEFSALSASELYLESLTAINTRRVLLPDDQKLRLQLSRLVRQARRGGKDLVTHPAGAHDDLANVACGAVALALGLAQGAASEPLINPDWLMPRSAA